MMFQSDAVHTLHAPQPETGMADRRPKSRRRALLGGVVVHSGGRFTIPCTIRNLSEDGARIAFKRGQMLPSSWWTPGQDRAIAPASPGTRPRKPVWPSPRVST